jgi:hypothetical protein
VFAIIFLAGLLVLSSASPSASPSSSASPAPVGGGATTVPGLIVLTLLVLGLLFLRSRIERH